MVDWDSLVGNSAPLSVLIRRLLLSPVLLTDCRRFNELGDEPRLSSGSGRATAEEMELCLIGRSVYERY